MAAKNREKLLLLVVLAAAICLVAVFAGVLNDGVAPSPKPPVAARTSTGPGDATGASKRSDAPASQPSAGERPAPAGPPPEDPPASNPANEAAPSEPGTVAPETPGTVRAEDAAKRVEMDPTHVLVRDLDTHMAEVMQRTEESDQFIEVQHLLIGFVKADGNPTVPGKTITRTMQEARELTAQLYARAVRGEDFDALVKEYTNDAYPGKYGMTLSTAEMSAFPGSFPRHGMVQAFGDIGWRLKLNQVAVADYDERKSPYGWHIIKRVK